MTAGTRTPLDLRLAVGSIEETVSVIEGKAGGAPSPDPAYVAYIEKARRIRASSTFPINPPIKLVDFRPEYPQSLRGTRVAGNVVLECLIDRNGAVRVERTIAAANPALEKAAIDAVSKWTFEPTRLHDVVIDTRMRVTINFTPEP